MGFADVVRRFLCRVGFHRWYTIRVGDECEVDLEVANELDPLGDGEYRAWVLLIRPLYHRVCLDCPAEENEIEEYRAERRASQLEVVARLGAEFVWPRKRLRHGRLRPLSDGGNDG